ncbi:MAG TPA: M48 family metalloprotease [Phycisphaerales bacterium]|nr:M48 family metalloprotease [Phycisphaerales bacterium]
MLSRQLLNRVLVVLGAAVVCMLGGCASDSSVISQADNFYTDLKPAVVTDPEVSKYLQKIGDRIIAAAKKEDAKGVGPDSHKSEKTDWMYGSNMKFYLVNSKTLNAFTTGGNQMYIYNELLQQCEDEDELAAVMAHEYAHVYCRHVQQGMNRQYTILGLALGAGAAGAVAGGKEHGAEYGTAAAGGAMALGSFVGMGFTRKDEAQADEYGFDFYTHAGWDPKRFGAFFQKMIDLGYDKTPEELSDHPTLASRVQVANKRAAELPKSAKKWAKAPIADKDEFAKIKARAVQVTKAMPSDEQLQQAQTLLAAFGNCIVPTEQPEQVEARKKTVVTGKKKGS